MGTWVQDQLFYTPEEFNKAIVMEQAEADLRVQRAKDNTNLAIAQNVYKAITNITGLGDKFKVEIFTAIAKECKWDI